MNVRCCLVYPTWIHHGWIKWEGCPSREKLMQIERVQCPEPSVGPVTQDGFTFEWCEKHQIERIIKPPTEKALGDITDWLLAVRSRVRREDTIDETLRRQKEEIEDMRREIAHLRSTLVAIRR